MASGSTLLFLTPSDFRPSVAWPLDPQFRPPVPTIRRGAVLHELMTFPDGITTTFYSKALWMPSVYSDATGVDVSIAWMAQKAVAGDVIWGVGFELLASNAQDLDSGGFAATQNLSASTANAAAGKLTYATGSITKGANIDSVVASRWFRILISRVGANGSDTMTDTAQFLGLALTET